MKKPAAVDRLPWDASGIDLRFQHYEPDLPASRRAWFVSVCLNAPELGLTVQGVFDSIRAALKEKAKGRNRYYPAAVGVSRFPGRMAD